MLIQHFLNAKFEKDIWVQIQTGPKLSEYVMGYTNCLSPHMDSSKHQDVGIILLMVIYWRLDFSDWKQIHAYMLKRLRQISTVLLLYNIK